MSDESAIIAKIQEQTASTAFQLVWSWIEKLGNTAWDKIKVKAAMRQYAEAYNARHGAVKVLGMSRPVPLHKVYTNVRVVPRNYLSLFKDHDQMHTAFLQAGRQHQAYESTIAESGLVVANRERFLNLLGAPGSGKSTFLRRLGQEALLVQGAVGGAKKDAGIVGKYKPRRLPVFIELRTFRSREINLHKAIVDEFVTCGFPESEAFVEEALSQGRLLLLLDGLDEVPGKQLPIVIDHVRAFIDKYGKERYDGEASLGNRFVTSCRTAHYKNAFPRFTDVVLADLSDEQIEQFASNWFSALDHGQGEVTRRFISTLHQDTNSAALELARTPLLLTFVCITYANGQELPPTRAKLYRRALDLLLREWAAERGVHDEPIHHELNAELELDMLADIAEEFFRGDVFFFPRHRITSCIRDYLGEQLKISKSIDCEQILEAIEVQQGLIVRRAEDTYSFSHLTIQEYLTARKIWELGRSGWEGAIKSYLHDPRWVVVFELMAGMGKADAYLGYMSIGNAKKLASVVERHPYIGIVIKWIGRHDASDGNVAPPASAAARAIQYALGCCVGLFCNLQTRSDYVVRDKIPLEFTDLATSISLALDLAFNLLRFSSFDCALSAARSRDTARLLINDITNDQFVARGRCRRLIIDLCTELVHPDLARRKRETFETTRALIEDPGSDARAVAKVLGLSGRPEKWRSTEDVQYLQGQLLLVRCTDAAYSITDDAWNRICSTILVAPEIATQGH